MSSQNSRTAQKDGYTNIASDDKRQQTGETKLGSPLRLTSSLALRQKPQIKVNGSSMILTHNLKQTMLSSYYLLCYNVKFHHGSPNNGPKGCNSLSLENSIKNFIQAYSHQDIVGAMTEFSDHVVFLCSSGDVGLEKSMQKGPLDLAMFAKLQWGDLLHFIHSTESPKTKDAIIDILKMFLSQRRALGNSNIAKARSSTLLEVRSSKHVRTIGSKEEKKHSAATVMQRFLSADPDNIHGLEIYLKGQHVQIDQKQDQIPGSSAKTRKTITGLARLDDGLASKTTLPPQVTKYGGDCNDVSFYLASSRGGPDDYVTLAWYFEHKGQSIEATDLPVINVGTRLRPVYFPPELCTVLDQQMSTASEFSFGDIADLVSTATIPKWIHNINAKDDIRYPGLKQSLERNLPECQISMTLGSLAVPCRMRTAPLIEYAKGKEVRPDAGTWKMDSITLAPSKQSLKVSILLIGSTQWTASGKVINTLKQLGNRLSHHGLTHHQIVEPHNSVAMDNQRLDKHVQNQIESSLKSLASNADLVVTVLPFEMKPLYDYIKRQSDIESGIHNICVIASRLAGDNNGYFFHIALKLNLKSGGQNQVLKPNQRNIIKLDKTMIVGLDTITPPKKAASGSKGIAAIVASSNGSLSHWPADFQVLEDKPLQEQLTHLLKRRLNLWKRSNGHAPQNVLIYHNGLSDKCCTDEVSSFQKACGVPMTLVAVNKDHQAKFEPLSSSFETTAPKPTSEDVGVIVRTKRDSRSWEFVIQSKVPSKNQKILPVRYSVVHDAIFSPDIPSASLREELEDLTHDMCYLSGCTTAIVGNTLPIHYVGLLCDRIRAYVRPWYHPRGKKKNEDMKPLKQDDIRVNEKIADTMFYV